MGIGNKDHKLTLIECRHNVKGCCQMKIMPWHALGTLYICCTCVEGIIVTKVLICLKLLNFVRFENFECNNPSNFVFGKG